MAYIYLVVVDLACIGCGTYLVVTEHYGWAWIPFVLAATTNVKR